MTHEHEDRDQGDVSLAKEHQRFQPADLQEPGERHGQILPQSLRRNQPCGHLDLGLLVSRTVRQ